MADWQVDMYRQATAFSSVKVKAETKEEAYEKAKELWLNYGDDHEDITQDIDIDGDVWLSTTQNLTE